MIRPAVISFLFCLISSAGFAQSEFGAQYELSLGKSFSHQNIGGMYERFSKIGKTSLQAGLTFTFSSSLNKKKSLADDQWNLFAGVRYGFSYSSSANLFGGFRITYGFGKESIIIPSAELGYHYTFNHYGKGGFATPSVGVGYLLPLNQSGESEEDPEAPHVHFRLAAGYRF